jgi:peptide/nickel transport system permease protein
MEYVTAARAFGVPTWAILLRHILPNTAHIVIITVVMDFSGLVLAEAVLSYVGIGVDPATASLGSLINAARFELARDPVVWWSLASAFGFMLALVLPANLLADAVREAFDPHGRGS